VRAAQRLFPLAKELAYRLHLNGGFFPPYPYMYSPAQLAYLCESISELGDVEGSIVEIGSAYGNTTVFLNEHMRCTGISRHYVCVDTFSGFTARDLEDEVSQRGRRPPQRAFHINKRKWVQRTLDVNHANNVTLYEADAVRFDYTKIAPIAFCLVDVDLYLPVKAALDRVFDLVPAGGRIVVDDCARRNEAWDGAYDAYCEFVGERGLEQRILLDKLGIIDK
jgi:O-methyltransferase